MEIVLLIVHWFCTSETCASFELSYFEMKLPSRSVMIGIGSFILGCLLSTMMVLNVCVVKTVEQRAAVVPCRDVLPTGTSTTTTTVNGHSLQGLRILVVLVAYDFSQLPHLEEVLMGYQVKINGCLDGFNQFPGCL